jgi:hypothetical protein
LARAFSFVPNIPMKNELQICAPSPGFTLHRRSSRLRRSDGKRRGQVAELAFMHKAADLGFVVTKPYGDSEPYDFILDSGHRLWRVQVKSTETVVRSRRRYYIQPGHCSGSAGRKNYTPQEIDFLVAYVVPHQAWYIVPAKAIPPRANIYLYPHSPNSRGRFERFRDAWCLMGCPHAAKRN